MTLKEIHEKGLAEARKATEAYLAQYGDRDACGFAWVTVYDVKLSSKVGKEFAKLGFKKSWAKGIYIWNPSGNPTQAISAKESGAIAYANVLKEAGFKAYAGSRLD